MSLIDEASCPCGRGETDIFSVPPTQIEVLESQFQPFGPVNSILGGGTIDFTVPGSGEMYIDPCMTYIYCRVRIRNDDADLVATDRVVPVNNFLHTMFSQVEVLLNGVNISSGSNLYPYRAYMETLLGYSGETKRTLLRTNLWTKDTGGFFDNMEFTNTTNRGGRERMQVAARSRSFEVMGKLHCDLFNSDRLLLNGVELKVRLTTAKHSFCLMSALGANDAEPKFKVILDECTLFVRRVKLSPGTALGHAKRFSDKRPAIAQYPITRVATRAFTIPREVQTTTLDNVFQGQLPTRIIIGFVRDDAFNGRYNLNPFNFQNFNLEHLSLYVNGRPMPMRAFAPKYDLDLYLREYHSLYSGQGAHFGDSSFDVTYDEYKSGNCLYAFDLTPDLAASETDHQSIVINGELRIEVRLAAGVDHAISCIVYGEFRNIIKIDKDRKVTTDFSQ